MAAPLVMRFVPVPGEITLKPLHDSGKRLPMLRLDEQVDVVIHDTEVQKHSLDLRLPEVHLVVMVS
jgi:hypothetical protein